MIVDCDQFWPRFEQHLLTATGSYNLAKPKKDDERAFQRLLCCQLATMGGVSMEADFKGLFPRCPNGQYLPNHFGGVDLALMSRADEFDPELAVGLELKMFSSELTGGYKRVDYFATGKFSTEDSLGDPLGMFLQKGCLTFCKEGQLLQDYCRAARILARQQRKFFILCGVMRYPDPALTAALLEERIETLIERFRCRSLLYCYYQRKFMIYAQLNQEEQRTQYTVKVLPLSTTGVFAFYVIVRRN